MKEIIGAALCAIPFIAIFSVMVREDGWVDTVAVWAISLTITAIIAIGAYLAFGGE